MGTRVHVGHVPYRVNERDLEHFFKGYGRIQEVILKNGYGFVEFSDYRDADDACHDLNGRDLMGERVTVEMARGNPRGRDSNNWRPPPNDYRRGGGGGGYYGGGRFGGGNRPERTENRMVVENLSSRVAWQELKDLFRSVGEVTYAVAHRTKQNEGLVEFASRSDMKRAIEKMDGKELNGRKIKLSEEKKRSRSRSRSRSAKRSRSGSRSRSRSKGDDDKKEKKERKRTRSASKSASRSPSPRANGDHSPSPKRDRTESEKKNEADANED